MAESFPCWQRAAAQKISKYYEVAKLLQVPLRLACHDADRLLRQSEAGKVLLQSAGEAYSASPVCGADGAICGLPDEAAKDLCSEWDERKSEQGSFREPKQESDRRFPAGA